MHAVLTGCGGKSDSAKKTAKVIEVDLTDEQYAFGVDKDQPDLLKEVNQFAADMKSDGTFDEICNRYFGDGTPVPVKSAAYDESKDQLVVATNAAFEPFEYMDGENYVGIDMEIAKALADKLGKELVSRTWISMPYVSLLASTSVTLPWQVLQSNRTVRSM